MIFFEKNSGKMFFITITVFLSAGFIFYQYFKLNPIKEMEMSNLTIFTDINQATNQQLPELDYNLQMSTAEWDNLREEFKKEQERQELLEFAQQYLNEKINFQEATSTEEEIKN